MSLITHLKSVSEFNAVTSKKDRLVVIDYHATWCGPCHAIAPKFETLSQQYRSATFCKVDVDAASDIAKQQGIRAMPTFQFFKDGNKVDEVKGANAAAIEAAIRRHTTGGDSGAAIFPGQGKSLNGDVAGGSTGFEAGYLKYAAAAILLYLWWTYSSTD